MSFGIVVATFDRPFAIQRLVRSIRDRFANVPIYVGDQSVPTAIMAEFYDAHDVKVLWLEYDCGVTRARNQIVAAVREEVFILCDDDFIITEATSFDGALNVLRARAEIGVVGGHLRNVFAAGGTVEYADVHWELFFEHDERNEVLISIPIHFLEPEAERIAGSRVFRCDAVLNFAAFRRSMFSEQVRWDTRFKSNGEHEDFYLNLKKNSEWQVYYLPTMTAEHHHPPLSRYDQMRNRQEGWGLLMSKWGFKQHLELGYGVRTIRDVHGFQTVEDLGYTRSTLRRLASARHKFLLGDGPTIPETAHIRQEKRIVADRLDEVALFVCYPPRENIDNDFVVFVKPICRSLAGGAVANRISYSWRKQADYLVYDADLSFFGGPVIWGEWTAVPIPSPQIPGLATFELSVGSADSTCNAMLASGETVFSDEIQTTDFPDLVYGWSRARKQPPLPLAGQDGNSPRVDMRSDEFLLSLGDVDIMLVTIVPGEPLAGPLVVSFDRFPFDFGACRGSCEVPAGVEKLRYLMPISRGMTAAPRLSY